MRRRLFNYVLAAWICALTLSACGGRPSPGPIPQKVPAEPEKVQTWAEKVPFGPGRAIYFRNLTDQTVRITLIGLYDCVNVLGGCVTTRPENLVVPPQQTVEGLVILPNYPHSAFDFKWHFQWKRVQPSLVQARAQQTER